MSAKDNAEWVSHFHAQHGRAPRVLHIGNIANNAYLNAKFLNKSGFDCDVMCYDYYHIMACPEWEDADYQVGIASNDNPDWVNVDLGGFERPDWFAQGSLSTCLDYLIAKREGNREKAGLYWGLLSQENRTKPKNHVELKEYSPIADDARNSDFKRNVFFRAFYFMRALTLNKSPSQMLLKNRFIFKLNKLKYPLGCFFSRFLIFAILLFVPLVRFGCILVSWVEKLINRDAEENNIGVSEWGDKWKDRYKNIFPNRRDEFETNDIIGYYDSLPKIRKLLGLYDLVHGYATDGIFGMLAEVPYVAYEHGTIRSTPFQATSQGRLCAMVYKMADFVCITNADNIVAAQKLDLKRIVFVPHPINERMLHRTNDQINDERDLHAELGSDFIVFHPARQHWGEDEPSNWEKGNDIFIRGFARFVNCFCINAKAIFVEWGLTVDKSKKLIKSLGIEANIVWISPQTATGMAKYIMSTDLLADQFYLGAFGSTLPRALACGKPAMLCLDEKLHDWCFETMPPVINACDDDSVLSGLLTVYRDKAWVKENAIRGYDWYQRFHSSAMIVDKLTSIYKSVLEDINVTRK